MKKKKLIIGAVVLAVTICAVLGLTNMFTKGAITGKLYRVDNVYEEIWNMVKAEKNGAQTILTTSIQGSYVDYDLGLFDNVKIPVNDEYNAVLSFRHHDELNQEELCIRLYRNNGKNSSLYVYNYQSNTLYGNREESHLIDNFTSLYCEWVEDDGKFNLENPGDYTFVLTEYPLSHE